MATGSEVRAAGALLGDALGGSVGIVREVQRAVAGRVFDALSARAAPATAPVRIAYEVLSASTYAWVRLGTTMIPRAVALAAAPTLHAEPISGARGGAYAQGALNGLWGDLLQQRYPALAQPFSLRSEGQDVALSPESIAAAYPEPTGQVVLFVHGLCVSEESWSLGAVRHQSDPTITYGSLLRDDLGLTPLYLRYNTGLCVADNARALADLLQEVVAVWPVPVTELVLVGHSMGGLVARGACRVAAEAGHDWIRPLRDVIALGTPHLGAPLERAADAAAGWLDHLPETRPVSRVLTGRSVGVKDLRYGACLPGDRHGHEVPAPRLAAPVPPDAELVGADRADLGQPDAGHHPALAHVAYHAVGAPLTRTPGVPGAARLGDLMVPLASASGTGLADRLPLPRARVAHVGGVTHAGLLNHPQVYAHLHHWIARRRAGEGEDNP